MVKEEVLLRFGLNKTIRFTHTVLPHLHDPITKSSSFVPHLATKAINSASYLRCGDLLGLHRPPNFRYANGEPLVYLQSKWAIA